MRKTCGRRPLALLLALLLLCALLPAAMAADPRAFRTSRYFETGYTAYASLVETAPGQFQAEVHLQFMPEHSGANAIASYQLTVNGGAAEAVPPAGAEASASPVYFAAVVPIDGDITALMLTPLTADGASLAEETVNLLPDIPAGSLIGTVARVNNPDPGDRLNLRTGPSSSAPSLRHYANGVEVSILSEEADGWLAVSIGTEGGMARGYMKKDFLATGDDAAKVISAIPEEAATVASWTLFSFPDETSAPVGAFKAGDVFALLGESSSWWHVLVEGETGFVRAGVLTEEEAPTLETTIPAAPETTPPPQTNAVPTDAPKTTDAPVTPDTDTEAEDSLRAYTAEAHVAQGYSVEAVLRETRPGLFDVSIRLSLADAFSAEDSILYYVLYVDGEKRAAIGADFTDEETSPYTVFTGTALLDTPFETLRLSPTWRSGGELEDGTVRFTVEP